MDEFTIIQLTENEFNNLVFMHPPSYWTDVERYPLREGQKFLNSLCVKPLHHVVQKVIERSGLDGQNLNPTKVFENIDVIARREPAPWFKSHAAMSRGFRKSLMTPIFIRNLTPGERNQCPSGTFYADDGNHRALVYAVHIACGATTYEPVEAIHATSWKGASNELGYQPQDSTALEDNGKLQKSGRSGRMEAITLEEALKTFSDTIKSKPQ
jgi:hypothetical protein